jgi:hypothetical protein
MCVLRVVAAVESQQHQKYVVVVVSRMQCSAIQCSAVLYSAVQCSAVLYSAVQYGTQCMYIHVNVHS